MDTEVAAAPTLSVEADLHQIEPISRTDTDRDGFPVERRVPQWVYTIRMAGRETVIATTIARGSAGMAYRELDLWLKSNNATRLVACAGEGVVPRAAAVLADELPRMPDKDAESLLAAIMTDPDEIDGTLPTLTTEERAAMDSLPPDFIKELIAGNRYVFADGKATLVRQDKSKWSVCDQYQDWAKAAVDEWDGQDTAVLLEHIREKFGQTEKQFYSEAVKPRMLRRAGMAEPCVSCLNPSVCWCGDPAVMNVRQGSPAELLTPPSKEAAIRESINRASAESLQTPLLIAIDVMEEQKRFCFDLKQLRRLDSAIGGLRAMLPTEGGR